MYEDLDVWLQDSSADEWCVCLCVLPHNAPTSTRALHTHLSTVVTFRYWINVWEIYSLKEHASSGDNLKDFNRNIKEHKMTQCDENKHISVAMSYDETIMAVDNLLSWNQRSIQRFY